MHLPHCLLIVGFRPCKRTDLAAIGAPAINTRWAGGLQRLFAAALVAMACFTAAPACADGLLWKDPITGSWTDGNNWCCKEGPPPDNDPLPPGPEDDARINNGGTAQLSLENAAVLSVYLGQFPGQSGTVEVYGGQLTTGNVDLSGFDTDPLTGGSGTIRLIEDGRWVNRSSMYVGYGGTGLVEVKGGQLRTPDTGFFSFDHAYNLGILLGSTGTVIVEDHNSTDGLWSTAYSIQVGDQGTGHLTVRAGGQVQAGAFYVGEDAESIDNTVTIAGANSGMQISGTLHLGQAGGGKLEVKEDASISTNLAQINTRSSVTIDHASWQNTSFLTAYGKLNVKNGGVVESSDIQIYNEHTMVTTQSYLIAENSLTVHGNGELFIDEVSTVIVSNQHSSIPSIHGLYVGNLTGRGEFYVQSGGKYHGGGASIDGLDGTRAIVQANGSWFEDEGVVVGHEAFGELQVLNGGLADFDIHPDANFFVGYERESNGNVTVTNGRLETNLLFLGDEGIGHLTVSGGGVVTSDASNIGRKPSGRGQAVVTGVGSQWEMTGDLLLGNGNNSSLRVDSGARVLVGTANSDGHVVIASGPGDELLTSNVTVDGAGSELSVLGDLTVGDQGFASLDITNEAIVANDQGWIGYGAGSGGTVVVDNASWVNRNSVVVGLLGNASLDIRNDGLVIAKEQMIVGPGGTLKGNGTVTGDGTVLFFQNNGNVTPGTSPGPEAPTASADDDFGTGSDHHGTFSSLPGTLTIDGNFTQTSTGRLQIDLASPSSYDVLNVTGTANLGGSLEIVLADGYTPAPNHSFQFLTAPSFTGNFSNVTVTSPSGDAGTFDIDFTPTGLALSNFEPAPSDFVIHTPIEVRASSRHDGTTYHESNLIDAVITEGSINTSATDINGSSTSNFGDSWAVADWANDGVLVLDMGSNLSLDGLLYAQRTFDAQQVDDYGRVSIWIETADPGAATSSLPTTLGQADAEFDLLVDDNGSTLRRYDFSSTLAGRYAVLFFTNGDPYFPGGQELRLFTAPGLDGDYNDDGTVDASDYVVLRKGLGTIYTANDFNTWRANFGRTSGNGAASSNVPEPSSLASLLVLSGCGLIARRRQHR